MATGVAVESLERLAQDVFDVVRQLTLSAPRGRRRPGDLKEGEFLTLCMLSERGTMIVGTIQRELGVLPAQMSRIIRSLESRDQPYVACRINPLDKRKVDVSLTEAGSRTLGEYRRHRVARIMDILRDLDDDDREHFASVMDRIRDIIRHKAIRS
jgi:DNA-binding MarR family transcriptional regulator